MVQSRPDFVRRKYGSTDIGFIRNRYGGAAAAEAISYLETDEGVANQRGGALARRLLIERKVREDNLDIGLARKKLMHLANKGQVAGTQLTKYLKNQKAKVNRYGRRGEERPDTGIAPELKASAKINRALADARRKQATAQKDDTTIKSTSKVDKTNLEKLAEFIESRDRKTQEKVQKELSKANARNNARKEFYDLTLKKLGISDRSLYSRLYSVPIKTVSSIIEFGEKQFIQTKATGAQGASALTKIAFLAAAAIENVRQGQGKQFLKDLKQQEKVSKKAARNAIYDALKDPQTYAFALLARPQKVPFSKTAKVSQVTKLPRTGQIAEKNTVFINKKTGSVRVSDATGKVYNAGVFKDLKGASAKKIQKAYRNLAKIQKKSADIARIGKEIKAQKKSTGLTRRQARKERKAEFIKKIEAEIRLQKKAKADSIKSADEAKTLGFKSLKQLRKYQETKSTRVANNIRKDVLKRLARRVKKDVDIARINRQIKGEKISRSLRKKSKKKTQSVQERLQRSVDKIRKQEDVRNRIADRKAKKLGFKDRAEQLQFQKLSQSARKGSLSSKARLRALLQKIKRRTKRNTRIAEARIRNAIRDATRVKIKNKKIVRTKKTKRVKRKVQKISESTRERVLKVVEQRARQAQKDARDVIANEQYLKLKRKKGKRAKRTAKAETATRIPTSSTVSRQVQIVLRSSPVSQLKPISIGLQDPTTKSRRVLMIKPSIRSVVSPASYVKTHPSLRPDISIVTSPKISSAIISDIALALGSAQAQRQAQAQLQGQISQQLLRTTSKTTKKKEQRPPKKRGIVAFNVPKVKTSSRKLITGYNVYVRERGRFIKANLKVMTKKSAQALGRYVVDNSTSATFVLRQSDKKPQVSTFRKKYVSPSKFRSPTKKSKLPANSRVEKRSKRIDTKGEKRGLRASRLLKKSKTKRRVKKQWQKKSKKKSSVSRRKS